jgi:methyltransferase (TIGR00027 family)
MRGRPSATALRAALRRAAHQLWDVPKVFDDPCAVPLVAGRISHAKPPRESTVAKSTRALLVARARLAEDLLRDAVARSVPQYVVLGAGLDTFACRNPYHGLRVFEVDHPATQSWKREMLAKVGLQSSATFAPVDFERQELAQELKVAGWSAERPSFFSCLGVASYLSAENLMAMLRFVHSLPAGSGIVFDVPTPSAGLTLRDRLVRGVVAAKLALQGEAVRSRYDPAALAAALCDLGFQTQVFDAAAINARYFAGRDDGLTMSGRSALIQAWT